MTVESKGLTMALDYSRGYANDVHGCFFLPTTNPKHTPQDVVGASDAPTGPQRPGKTGSKWLVLFQAHTQQELNLTNTYDKGKRTLKWGTPYDNAVQSITVGGSSHNQSALLRDWYMEKVRKFGTFICIPPKSDLRFFTGYAAPQTTKYKEKDKDGKDVDTPFEKETRPGGGMQWRLAGLPKGTITLTTGLFTVDSGKTAQKEDKEVDLEALLKDCVTEYNKKPIGGVKLPEDLAKKRTIGNNRDDEAIVKFYMDMSMTKLVDFDPAGKHAKT
jgi:hypothetical protein